MYSILISIILDINPNPTRATYARPYDSSQGMSSNFILIILSGFLIFALYIGYRVWKSLRDEKQRKKF